MLHVSCSVNDLRTKQTAQPMIPSPTVVSKSSTTQVPAIAVTTVSSSAGWQQQ